MSHHQRVELDYLSLLVEMSVREIGRRDPIYRVHRWWGRRFSSIYRFMIAHHLFGDRIDMVYRALKDPETMVPYASGRHFVDPFSGGGTGVIEACRAGFNVTATDINPVAVAISRSMIVLSRGIDAREYEKISIGILDGVLKDLEKHLLFEGKQIVYVLYTRGRIPTWIASRKTRRGMKITICPSCGGLNSVSDGEKARCGSCGDEYVVSKKPLYTPRFRLCMLSSDGSLGAYASRVGSSWVSLVDNRDLCRVIEESVEYAERLVGYLKEKIRNIDLGTSREVRKLLKGLNGDLGNIFTPRTLLIYSRLIDYINDLDDENYTTLLKTALSESSKVASTITLWDPGVSEPIPAAANKTLWVPEHGVEYNIVAHYPGTLRSIGRRGLASVIRDQLETQIAVRTLGSYATSRSNVCRVFQGSLNEGDGFLLPHSIDLSILDPPYPGGVENYTDLSVVHFIVLSLFNGGAGSIRGLRSKDLSSLNIDLYFLILGDIVRRIRASLSPNGSIYVLFNSKSTAVWFRLLDLFRDLCVHDTYYVLGESPGRLGRSGVRGLFILHFKPCSSIKEGGGAIYNLMDLAVKRFNVDVDMGLENKCIKSFMDAFREVFGYEARVVPGFIGSA